MRDQPVQVGVRRHRQVQVLHAQVVDGLRSNKSMKKLTTLGWWGLHSTEVPYLLLNQQPRGLILNVPQKKFTGKIIDVAQVNQPPWLEESGQWLENVGKNLAKPYIDKHSGSTR